MEEGGIDLGKGIGCNHTTKRMISVVVMATQRKNHLGQESSIITLRQLSAKRNDEHLRKN